MSIYVLMIFDYFVRFFSSSSCLIFVARPPYPPVAFSFRAGGRPFFLTFLWDCAPDLVCKTPPFQPPPPRLHPVPFPPHHWRCPHIGSPWLSPVFFKPVARVLPRSLVRLSHYVRRFPSLGGAGDDRPLFSWSLWPPHCVVCSALRHSCFFCPIKKRFFSFFRWHQTPWIQLMFFDFCFLLMVLD